MGKLAKLFRKMMQIAQIASEDEGDQQMDVRRERKISIQFQPYILYNVWKAKNS